MTNEEIVRIVKEVCERTLPYDYTVTAEPYEGQTLVTVQMSEDRYDFLPITLFIKESADALPRGTKLIGKQLLENNQIRILV